MKITEQQLGEFKRIWLQKTGQQISDDEAYKNARRVLDVVAIIAKNNIHN